MTAAPAVLDADDGDGQGARAGVDPLARAVFALLVLACVGAFFLTQRLKHTPTAVQRFELTPRFSPASARPEDREERLSFKVSKADAVTVTIIDSRGNTVATLLRAYPAPRYKQLSLRWNGRRGTAHRYVVLTSPTGHRTIDPLNRGARAPAGEYRIRVALRAQGREVLSPRSFALVAR